LCFVKKISPLIKSDGTFGNYVGVQEQKNELRVSIEQIESIPYYQYYTRPTSAPDWMEFLSKIINYGCKSMSGTINIDHVFVHDLKSLVSGTDVAILVSRKRDGS
jgi:hypothetical protein